MRDADSLLDDNLIVYMDGKKIGGGKQAWNRWVRFLHYNADKTITGLALSIDSISENDGSVIARAKWRGTIRNQPMESDGGTVAYEVRGGKITSIRTCRKNYAFIYGKRIAGKFVFYLLLARMLLWRDSASGRGD